MAHKKHSRKKFCKIGPEIPIIEKGLYREKYFKLYIQIFWQKTTKSFAQVHKIFH